MCFVVVIIITLVFKCCHIVGVAKNVFFLVLLDHVSLFICAVVVVILYLVIDSSELF